MTASARRTVGTPAPEPVGGRTYLVPFFGDGEAAVLLTVIYIAEYPRGLDGTCAYCHGDPCAERSGAETLIGDFFLRNGWAETCPCCCGRPT